MKTLCKQGLLFCPLFPFPHVIPYERGKDENDNLFADEKNLRVILRTECYRIDWKIKCEEENNMKTFKKAYRFLFAAGITMYALMCGGALNAQAAETKTYKPYYDATEEKVYGCPEPGTLVMPGTVFDGELLADDVLECGGKVTPSGDTICIEKEICKCQATIQNTHRKLENRLRNLY